MKPLLFKTLFCWSICVLIIAKAFSQNISLNHYTAYPDTNICNLNVPVTFMGSVNWTYYLGTPYSLHINYGDGNIQIVNKSTLGFANASDTFKIQHSYTTSGIKTVSIVLVDNLNVPVDSVVRDYNVGNCVASSGTVYFDCIQNCVQDSTELGLPYRFFKFSRNGVLELHWLDSIGSYNIPVFSGDTIQPYGGVVDFQLSFVGSCGFLPITDTATERDIAIRLNEAIYFSDLQGVPFFCTNQSHTWSWYAASYNNSSWRIRVDYGNGNLSSYYSGPTNFLMFYNTPGVYEAKYYLYNYSSYYGPLMRLKKTVYVDTCHSVAANVYYDNNENCQKDNSEQGLNAVTVSMTSSLMGPLDGYTNSAGLMNVSVYPGDTLQVYNTINVSVAGGSIFDDVYGESGCNQNYITDTTTVQNIPFLGKVKSDYVIGINGDCIGDTISFALYAHEVGLPTNMLGKLYGIFGDGTMDSVNISFNALDTATFNISHHFQALGILTNFFVLKFGSYTDTISLVYQIEDCFSVYTKAYYDINRNCVKDANESYVSQFIVSTNSGSFFSGSNGVAQCFINGAADSVLGVKDQTAGHLAYYYRNFSGFFCSWPTLTSAGQYCEIPLIDTLILANYLSNTLTYSCNGLTQPHLYLSVSGNVVIKPYYLHYYTGDGTFYYYSLNNLINYPSQPYFNWQLSNYTYQPGIYYPGIKVFDLLSGQVVYQYQHPIPTIAWDTCNLITGNLFVDNNSNCMLDIGETSVGNVGIQVTKNNILSNIFTNSTGQYHISADVGDVVDIQFPDLLPTGGAITCVPPVQNLVFQNAININVPYLCPQGNSDVSVVVSHHYFYPNYIDTMYVYIQNNWCNTSQGTLSVLLDNSMSFISTSYPGMQQSGQSLSWFTDTVANLPSVIKIAVQINGSVQMGQVICVDANLQLQPQDVNMQNNNFTLCDTVLSSIPNVFKISATGNGSSIVLPGEPIVYTIGFKNTTSDTIKHVILIDTLSSYLDLNTIEALNASYPFTLTLLSNVMKVAFDSLILIPGQEGFFTFSIMPDVSLPLNSVITNQASVIFGFYIAGISSNTYNEIDTISTNIQSSNSPVEGDVVISPNPARDNIIVTLKTSVDEKTAIMQIMDSRGVNLNSISINQGINKINTSDLPPGMYILRIILKERSLVRKLIIQ